MERSNNKKGHYDETLLTVVIILVAVGLVMLYSTSSYNGEVKFHDPYYYLKKQGFATFIGFLGMVIVSRVDYHRWAVLAIPGYLAAIALSVAVMLFGDEYNGSKRWLSLGPVSFQPSEFAKVAVILFLACLVTKYVKRMDKFRTLVLMMLPVLPIVALVGASNLSTAIIILGIAVVLIFVASPKYSQFIWMGAAGIAFMAVFLAMESYRLERLAIWRNPEQYEKGYQTLQGLYAIGSGGLFGRGLGNSVQKLGFLPEAQNDMIFSIICEELGLVGAGIIILLFFLLIWRFFVIATKAPDLLGALIASGAMAHMMIQVILNIAVVTNSIPNTGITLPFISYGGTSVVFLLLEMGLVLSVSGLVE
ncbi:putative lipid II flippase FtsW [Mediterraneibacter glycyrrhizinilyticus]|uniref:Probable peptidoglycan glycosyltransferase FtsW n=1 Tax=Candidatus Mediterraneibacter faecipullorum TaxID=2838670 RepID=A0A9D2SS87_9FIRM|nr:putative lipid II flippase FtsW [Mediterraneibacter glycyrrhizinilyticus]MBM6802300.1 putative lipid II flippase FtsW [Mediterraneibacter glycyrrhizinilyticus]MDM8125572.1 putative lipid II flippase FtsW [Mediterraneibacter glycyrrhizinilyticus]MDM8210240.1 putative lipid II flippase FtsW [Mediterraneibacter glycyrrhizinilyticus]HJC33327.1 putative lipid II flippase FtsW [Candidatus Mediterraneibacter faecipullorum]